MEIRLQLINEMRFTVDQWVIGKTKNVKKFHSEKNTTAIEGEMRR